MLAGQLHDDHPAVFAGQFARTESCLANIAQTRQEDHPCPRKTSICAACKPINLHKTSTYPYVRRLSAMILEWLRQCRRRPRELRAVEWLQHPETYPGLAPWCENDTRVRFVRLPSFEPYSVWVLQRRDNIAQVRRVEWDHLADAPLRDAFPDAAPTTFAADAQLPVALADELLSELAAIHLPPFLPVSTLGLDGTSYAIEFGSSWRSAALSWWCEPPEEWQTLASFHERALALFERFLPVSTARSPQLQTGT